MPLSAVRAIVLAIGLSLCSPSAIPAQNSDAYARAAEILNRTRAALGGEAALSAIHSLSAAGDFRVGSGEQQVSGDVTIEILAPDKLMRVMR